MEWWRSRRSRERGRWGLWTVNCTSRWSGSRWLAWLSWRQDVWTARGDFDDATTFDWGCRSWEDTSKARTCWSHPTEIQCYSVNRVWSTRNTSVWQFEWWWKPTEDEITKEEKWGRRIKPSYDIKASRRWKNWSDLYYNWVRSTFYTTRRTSGSSAVSRHSSTRGGSGWWTVCWCFGAWGPWTITWRMEMHWRRDCNGRCLLCRRPKRWSESEDSYHSREGAVHWCQEGRARAVLLQQCLGVRNSKWRTEGWRSRQSDNCPVGAHMEEDWGRRSTRAMEGQSKTGASWLRGSRPADNPKGSTYGKQTVPDHPIGHITMADLGHHVWRRQDGIPFRKGI